MPPDTWIYLFLLVLGMERTAELVIARSNESWIRARGGAEYGRSFTVAIMVLHTLWFASFAAEAFVIGASLLIPPEVFIPLVFLLQGGRYWCILSLGRYWNTKILVLPGASAICAGPYRLLRHPNYLIVMMEIPLYPACFGCWLTTVVFGLGNVLLLRVRIQQEERALARNAPVFR